VQVEPLGLGERCGRGGEFGGVRDADLAEAPDEVRGTQAGGEPGRAIGREDVVRARDVVAERGPGARADEQAPGSRDSVAQRLRRLSHQLEVLRRKRLGQGQCMLGVMRADQGDDRARLSAGLELVLEGLEDLLVI